MKGTHHIGPSSYCFICLHFNKISSNKGFHSFKNKSGPKSIKANKTNMNDRYVYYPVYQRRNKVQIKYLPEVRHLGNEEAGTSAQAG